jgi:L-fuconolactonase
MRIDAHQHFWIYNPTEYGWIADAAAALRRNFLPEDLRPELERGAYHGTVAVQTRQTLDETRWLLELAEKTPFILGVVGWVDLRSPLVRSQLQALARNPKLVGIRHIVQSEADDRFLLQADFLRGVAVLADFDLAYDILIYPRHLAVAAEFVQRFPGQRFVLNHLAKPPVKSGELHSWARGIRELAVSKNLFCKLSGLVTEADWRHWKPEDMKPYLDIAFECFGPDRLMVGSDWPVCTVAASFGEVVGIVENYLSGQTPGVRDAVLGRNAQRFWRLAC